jgi:hypothetical protein
MSAATATLSLAIVLLVLAAALHSLPASAERMEVRPQRSVPICPREVPGSDLVLFGLCSNLPIEWIEV